MFVKTGERFELVGDRSSPHSYTRRIPTVEVWVGGRCFTHDCTSDEEARQQVMWVSFDLGL